MQALSQVTRGGGPPEEGPRFDVAVQWNQALRSLDGLEFLGSGGSDLYLTVSDNDVLDDIDALGGIESLLGLDLRENPSLSSLEALSSLTSADSLELVGLPVASLTPLSGVTVYDYLRIRDLDLLEDLSELASLDQVAHLSVEGNESLRALGLPALSSLEMAYIHDNPTLEALGPNAVGASDLRGLTLSNCPVLHDLEALAAARSVTGSLTLEGLDALESLDALDSIESVSDALIIINDTALPQDDAEQWAAARGAGFVKVDGNLGAEPHPDECPWTGDGWCDEDDGTRLCIAGSDNADCRGEGE